jgi:transposase
VLLAEVDKRKTKPVKRIPKRKLLPKALPRKVVIIDLAIDQ